MRPALAVLAFSLALAPGVARGQSTGLTLEAGPAFLTKAGALGVGTDAIESDTGYGLRVRLRLGLQSLSLAGEFQTASQDYAAASGVTPENLNARYLGVSAAFHPITILRLTPYAEAGLGRLFFSDESITQDEGSRAMHAGLGARLELTQRVGLDLGLRLQRQGDLRFEGLPGEFKYDPKIFAVLLTIQIG